MLVVKFDRSARRRLALALGFFSALLLVRGAWELGAATPAGGGLTAPIREVTGRADAVVLTFNITWGREVPEAVLDRLAASDARALFFVTGPWAQENPDLVRRMVAEGHDVGSLGHTLVNLTAAEPDRIATELQASAAALQRAGAPPPQFFRPPGGVYDDEVLAAARDQAMRTVLWSVDGRDWLTPGTDVIVSTVLDNARPGSIVLLHATDGSRQTLEALPQLLRGLRERQLRALPLSELLGSGRT